MYEKNNKREHMKYSMEISTGFQSFKITCEHQNVGMIKCWRETSN